MDTKWFILLSGAIPATSQATGTLIAGGGIGCGGDVWENLFQAVSGVLVNTQAASQTSWQTIAGDGVN
ncbi:hypothetical protein ON010_g11439 [Phytophthora cinnamomi]|nr:hypothetical protein ON010_g11439 [Phytophthora cinnamomi]